MKTLTQISNAREYILKLTIPTCSTQQLTLLSGIVTALSWVLDDCQPDPIQDLLDGWPILYGNRLSEEESRFQQHRE